MKRTKKELSCVFMAVLIAVAAVLVLMDGSLSQQRTAGPGEDSIKSLDSGWTMRWEQGEERDLHLPLTYSGRAGDKVEYSHEFNFARTADAQLCVQTYLSPFRVYIDDQLVYEYGSQAIQEGRLTVGNGYHIIPIPAQKGQLRIETEVSRGAPYATIGSVQVATGANFLKMLVRDNCMTILASGIMLLIGVYTLSSFFGVTRIWGQKKASLTLSLLSFCASFWMLGRSGLLQIFTDRILLANSFDFLSFFLLPLAALLFFRENLQRQKDRFLQICIGMEGAFFVFACVSYLLRWIDFSRMLVVAHILLIPCILCLGYNLIFHCRSTVVRLGFGALLLGEAAELIVYQLIRFEFLEFHFLEIGMLAFVMCMAYEWRKQNQRYQQRLIRQEMLESLAYTDALTGLGNRAAYDRKIQAMCTRAMSERQVHLLMVDINHLKQVNDSMGHQVGDDYLRTNADLLAEHIGELGQLYRIGGDEFAAVLECSEKKCRELMQRLSRYTGRAGDPLSANFSVGCATFDPTKDSDLTDTFNRADQVMYRCKQENRKRSAVGALSGPPSRPEE